MTLEDFGEKIPPLSLNLKKRYDEKMVIVHKRNHEMSIKDQTHRLIQEVGGVEKVVQSGDTVLIKANASHPRTVPEGAVVDSQVVFALIEECFKAGAEEVYVGDATSQKEGTLPVFHDLGYRPIIEKTGAKLIDLNEPPYIRVDVPFAAGLQHKSYIFSENFRKFDVLISAAKMKTHSEAQVTLGMKNLIGAPPVNPFIGAARQVFHKEISLDQAPNEIKPKEKFKEYVQRTGKIDGEKLPNERLCKVIVDLNLILPIAFTVIDGTIGMQGQGPWSGEAICTNALVAGYNVLATDSIATRIMGFDPYDIKKFQFALERKLGTIDLNKIELLGDNIEGLTKNYQPAHS